MTRTSIRLEQAQTIQDALHRLVASPHFSNSTFLRLLHQQIQKLSEEFDSTMQEVYSLQEEKTEQVKKDYVNKELVYISIYCSDGLNIDSWKRVVENLPKQYISRPIYINERNVQKAVKAKPQLMNEGYVAIYVEKQAINQPEKPDFPLTDKWGHPLLSLKDRAIDLQNVEYFWHDSKHYLLTSKGLIFFRSVPDLIEEE